MYTFPHPAAFLHFLNLLWLCCSNLINNPQESPAGCHHTSAVKKGRTVTALRTHGCKNRLQAWERDSLCSLRTLPTDLSIVKMGRWGEHKPYTEPDRAPTERLDPKFLQRTRDPGYKNTGLEGLTYCTLNGLKRVWRETSQNWFDDFIKQSDVHFFKSTFQKLTLGHWEGLHATIQS